VSEILRLDDVWKLHRRWRRRPQSLKETLIKTLRGIRPEYEDFWAVRGCSLSVARGEAVGFCGANGAGKSTLLRVVSGILPPTRGRITVRGRLATLLELGAGFLPDLTGRENVELNGAILGLTDGETAAKMESIVSFADLGDFIDSPVSTYSTGMYMRLGFAIASHVDADILVLDEVLAVGDAGFQQKCAGWLERLRAQGTTVLMVSHDLPTLVDVCDRVVWMDHGRVHEIGDPARIVERYRASQRAQPPLVAEASSR